MPCSTPDRIPTRAELLGKITVLEAAVAANERELARLLAIRARQQDATAEIDSEMLLVLEAAITSVAAAILELDQYVALVERLPLMHPIGEPGYEQ